MPMEIIIHPEDVVMDQSSERKHSMNDAGCRSLFLSRKSESGISDLLFASIK